MKHIFIVTSPEEKPRQFILKGKRIGLGRGTDNDIHLEIDSVSSSHLEFRKTENGYEMEDLGSTNGTRVNGKAVQITDLKDGDRILIGETLPAQFLILAEDEKWEAGTKTGSEADQIAAAEFVSMSDRLVKLEANIEEKEEEAAKLDAQLAELRDSYQKQLTEYGEARLALEKLEEEISQRKQQGRATDGEMKQLEDSLIEKTHRVKLMSTNLTTQKEQISQLENKGPSVASSPPQKVPSTPNPRPPSIKVVGKKAPAGAKTVKLIKHPGVAPATKVIKKKRP